MCDRGGKNCFQNWETVFGRIKKDSYLVGLGLQGGHKKIEWGIMGAGCEYCCLSYNPVSDWTSQTENYKRGGGGPTAFSKGKEAATIGELDVGKESCNPQEKTERTPRSEDPESGQGTLNNPLRGLSILIRKGAPRGHHITLAFTDKEGRV